MEQENFLDSEILILNEKKRPTAITVVCILGFAGAAVAIPLIFTKFAARIGGWYPPVLAVSTINEIVCMTGLWKMKKWAVYLYTCFFITSQLLMLSMGVWGLQMVIIPIIVIAILINFIQKMD